MNLPQAARIPNCFLRFGGAAAQAKKRLYCFAHAGGTAASYAPWARLLAPDIEVCAVEQAGHGSRLAEEPLESVVAMALEILPSLIDLQSDQLPFAFYGHSLGAIVAYEIAQELRHLEQSAVTSSNTTSASRPSLTLRHLFIGAVRAPHLPPSLPPIAHLDQEAFLSGVQQRYGGISDAVLAEPELLEMILPPLRADFAAYEGYLHADRRGLACPVSAFAGTLDPVVGEEAVAAWADHTSGPFRMHTVQGDHFFLADHREQVLGIIARALRSQVVELQADSAGPGRFRP